MRENNIKAILFDFMGVLLLKRRDYVPDPLIDAIDAEIGQVTDDAAFKRETLRKYNLNEVEFEKILRTIDDKYEANDELWRLLPELRQKYKLAIINNGTVLTLPLFEKQYHIKDNFDLYVNSAIEGVRKPDPKIYLLTAERLGVLPGQCLYMDDVPANTDAAAALGMETIWWENREEGMRKFKEFILNS